MAPNIGDLSQPSPLPLPLSLTWRDLNLKWVKSSSGFFLEASYWKLWFCLWLLVYIWGLSCFTINQFILFLLEAVRELSNRNKMRDLNDFSYVKLTIKLGVESLQRKLMSPLPSPLPPPPSSSAQVDLFHTIDA